MKRRNADKDSLDLTNNQNEVNYFSRAVKTKVAKKNKHIVPTTGLIESVNNLLSQKNIPCTSPTPKKSKCKTSHSLRDKKLSDFLDIINEPSLEAATLKCGFTRWGRDFYDVPCEELARNLLGQLLVRKLENGTLLKGKIVETECYLGGMDKASHSYNGKITERNLPMYMKPGTTYVYFTYGMYHCFNISSQGAGAAVLVRAVEPLEGSDHMLAHRITSLKRKTSQAVTSSTTQSTSKLKKMLHEHELCNGPAKLCISFQIEKLSCNKQNLSEWEGMWVEKSAENVEVREHQIVKTHRIGIDSSGTEWAMKPLRFYLMESKAVSKRDKSKEKELKMVDKLLSS